MSRWRKCQVRGCKRLHHAKGFCQTHYKDLMRVVNFWGQLGFEITLAPKGSKTPLEALESSFRSSTSPRPFGRV
jgi:hypothetical protein